MPFKLDRFGITVFVVAALRRGASHKPYGAVVHHTETVEGRFAAPAVLGMTYSCLV